MIIVDTALAKREAEGRPIRVGLVGAGYMGRGLTLQVTRNLPGMRIAAIANRTVAKAVQAYGQAGIADVAHARRLQEVERAVERGRAVVTDDPSLLCRAGNIDAVIEATGEVEFGAGVAVEAIEHGKHLILMNAELDALVGPILKVYADRAGVVVSNVDGDQPGAIMNLLRWVRSIGFEPVLGGNIKGLQDHYRTPETQQGFAERHRQGVRMITSFADGTKIAMEMAVVANATGFRVASRGMLGPRCRHVTEAPGLFPQERLRQGGIVDYVLGAEPGPGVFVLGYSEDPVHRQYNQYLKMGDGPFYTFYVPYHLPHLESPLTVARAVLFHDAAVTPLGPPVVDVLTAAKRDLRRGEVLDGIGGFTVYGVADNHEVCAAGNLLPMSQAEGCVLKRDLPRDAVLTVDDVELPAGRLCDRLRAEQDAYFGGLPAQRRATGA